MAQGSDPLLIDTDNDFAQIWSFVEQDRNWSAVALSADGARRYGAVRSGSVHRTLSPGDWAVSTAPEPRAWDALATSADGSVVVVTEYTANAADPASQVWISDDAGETWSGVPKTGVLSVNWMSDVAMSSDGAVIALANDGFGSSGDLFVSTDRGVSWTVFDSNRRWSAIAMSSDGTRMAAVDRAGGSTGQDTGRIWTSSDTGATWVEQAASPLLSSWSDIAMSADGSILAAVALTDNAAGGIYVSTDFGVNWSEIGDVGTARWSSVTISRDGSRMVAGAQNGALYLSTDVGNSWAPIASVGNGNWSSVSLSADGLTLLAAKGNGRLYVWEGAGDEQDDFPSNVAASVDTDSDGAPNAWNLECDLTCQSSSSLSLDLFPDDASESMDADGDGLGDNADQCDDTPGSELADVNGEGCGPSERDTDGDGLKDNLDAFPNNPNETADSDGDGYGDNEETDAGTDPNDADDQPMQSGLPIWLLLEAVKSQSS